MSGSFSILSRGKEDLVRLTKEITIFAALKLLNMKTIKISFSFLLTLILISLSSCSRSSEDTMKLLAHVPSDALALAIVDNEAFSRAGDNQLPAGLKDLLGSDAVEGQRLVIAVISDSHAYLCGLIKDEKAFEKIISKENSGTVARKSGFSTLGDAAWNEEFFCMDISGKNIYEPDAERMMGLKEKESVASLAYASELAGSDSAVAWLANIGSALEFAGSKGNQIRMGFSMVFNGAEWLAGDCDIEKDKVELDMKVLDGNFRPAEYLLPSSKIDTSVFSRLGEGDMVCAMGVPSDLITRLESLAAVAGMDELLARFKGVDGTVAFASSEGSRGASAVVAVKDNAAGQSVAEGLRLLTGESDVTVDGNLVVLRSSEVTGKLSVPDMNRLGGAIFGFAANGKASGKAGVESLLLTIEPDGKSVELKIEMKTAKNFSIADLLK